MLYGTKEERLKKAHQIFSRLARSYINTRQVSEQTEQAKLDAYMEDIDILTLIKWRDAAHIIYGVSLDQGKIIWEEYPSILHEESAEEFRHRFMKQMMNLYDKPPLTGNGSAGKIQLFMHC